MQYYYSPEGRKLRSRNDVEAYLRRTNGEPGNLKVHKYLEMLEFVDNTECLQTADIVFSIN